jgi:glycolate oxidase FAD binding subunit
MSKRTVVQAEAVRAEAARIVGDANTCVETRWNEASAGVMQPAAVARPGSEEETAELLRLAAANQWTVLLAGRGRQLDAGNLGQPADLVVSFERMQEVVYYSPGDLVVSVQPGVTLAALARTLAEQGQMLPLDPFVPDDATIGGVVSTGVSGPRRALYGGLRDMVIGLRTVWGDGRTVRTGGRVVKNVAGYDMTKLFIGAYGTLGALTEVTFKLRPLPLHRETVLLHGSHADARAVALEVMTSELIPSRLELVSLGPASGDWTLAVDCDESEAAATYQSNRLRAFAAVRSLRADVLKGDEAEAWWRMHHSQAVEAPVCVRLTGRPTDLTEVVASLHRTLTEAGWEALWSVTVPAGTARVFLRSAAGGTLSGIPALLQSLRQAALQLGGTAVLERAPAPVRQGLDVFGPLGSVQGLMLGIKRTADPHNILGPGRFAGGI